MPLAVVCFCSYFCNRSLMWRGEDFDSFKWIKALKGEEIRGYATVPVNGTWRRLTNANVDSAVDWFASIAAEHLKKRKIKGPFIVIPVPNSKCVVSSTVKPQTRKLAKALCDVLGDGCTVVDCLRWKKNLGSASKEGARVFEAAGKPLDPQQTLSHFSCMTSSCISLVDLPSQNLHQRKEHGEISRCSS